MLLELFSITTLGGSKPLNIIDSTTNSNDGIGCENHIELVFDNNAFDLFSVQGGETTKAELSDTVLAYVQVMEKLTALSKLRKNWDGYGAGPISPNTIDNVKAVALQQWLWNFSLWQIAPGVNGDIFINFKGKKKQASIVIGPDVFSYFVEDETSLEGEENLEFNGARISLLMNQIAYG